ncbi:hypothetical protein [Streptomyces sp. CA-111067]|uniref:hypothetical protein n=1 Tax=Streptomyces sp. CA-111067 TaxID=3240046 RepID=UPI003D993237
MTATAEQRRSVQATLTGWRSATLTRWRTRLRATHSTTMLRWLRAGVLAMVVVTALLYLVVSREAGQQIAAARRTDQAIGDIGQAQQAARNADAALSGVFQTGQVALIGTGTDFANQTARIYTYVTSAADGNAAGRQGLTEIQFVQGQLTTCVQLADSAVRDYSRLAQDAGTSAGQRKRIVQAAQDALDHPEEKSDGGRAVPGTGGLIPTLNDLKLLEQDAQADQRHSPWLDPVYVWPLLVGPSAVMALLVLATGHVMARHFRRYVGVKLPTALLATTAAGVVTAVLSGIDEHHLAAHPRAGHPVTLALALTALAAAAVLTYLAYRPRLAEYRFSPS